ncbi:hypothetical protein HBA55_26095 [Pseudomaricurvus alkylphenolicus]|uniref:hypothetical protein n=1 Tax=Pseudomaricurvus alkylphenolicus TaxID=1306991 RepID=UPI0014239CB0|nr:hypothetical protein [Pseudomaricurvus alkylphenolicus]NIB43107.1 hypothetical protein [Pseudomaricurvus alkylphenolicus]
MCLAVWLGGLIASFAQISSVSAFTIADGATANSRTQIMNNLNDLQRLQAAQESRLAFESRELLIADAKRLLSSPEAILAASVLAAMLSAILGGVIRGRHEHERTERLQAKVERHRAYRARMDLKLHKKVDWQYGPRQNAVPAERDESKVDDAPEATRNEGLVRHQEPEVVQDVQVDEQQIQRGDAQCRVTGQDPHFAQVKAASNVIPFGRPRRNDDDVKRSIRDKTANYTPPAKEEETYIVSDGTDDVNLYVELDLPDLSKIKLDESQD